MRLEIGGGTRNRGDGWVNLDMIPGADIQHDLNVLPWPVESDSVDEVYTSHCIEHVEAVFDFLNEIVRVGKVGCAVEIRCPAPHSELAMVCGHVHVFGPQVARNIEYHFPRDHWKQKKRLRLMGWRFQPSEMLGDAKRELPFLRGLSDEVIMRWFPRVVHDTVFSYQVTNNEFFEGAESGSGRGI